MFENRKVTTFFVIFKLFSQKVLHRLTGRRTNPRRSIFFILSAALHSGVCRAGVHVSMVFTVQRYDFFINMPLELFF